MLLLYPLHLRLYQMLAKILDDAELGEKLIDGASLFCLSSQND